MLARSDGNSTLPFYVAFKVAFCEKHKPCLPTASIRYGQKREDAVRAVPVWRSIAMAEFRSSRAILKPAKKRAKSESLGWSPAVSTASR